MTSLDTTSAPRSPIRSTGGRDARPSVDVGRLFDLLPPHSPEAEMALLGSMILDPTVIGDVLPLVAKPDAFYLARNWVLPFPECHLLGDVFTNTGNTSSRNPRNNTIPT